MNGLFLESITKTYSEKVIIENITVNLETGITGILGNKCLLISILTLGTTT